MRPDLGTIMLIVVIFYILQVIAFSLQYSIDRAQRGAREWVIWSVLFAVGFSLILARRAVPPPALHFVIALSNACLFAGHLFLYAGIGRFLGKSLPRAPL